MSSGRRTRWIGAIAIVALAAAIGLASAHSGLVRRTKTVATPVSMAPVNPLVPKPATATCPKHSHVALGAVSLPETAIEEVSSMAVSGKRGWRTKATNGDHADPGTETSIAYCRKGPKLTSARKTVTLPMAASGDEPTKAIAQCPKGTRVAFGGFAIKQTYDHTYPDVYLAGLQRSGRRGWSASAISNDSGEKLTSIAYCGKHVPKTRPVQAHLDAGAFTGDHVTATCHGHKRLIYGGFKADVTSPAFVVIRGLDRTSSKSWKAGALFEQSGRLTAIAYCG